MTHHGTSACLVLQSLKAFPSEYEVEKRRRWSRRRRRRRSAAFIFTLSDNSNNNDEQDVSLSSWPALFHDSPLRSSISSVRFISTCEDVATLPTVGLLIECLQGDQWESSLLVFQQVLEARGGGGSLGAEDPTRSSGKNNNETLQCSDNHFHFKIIFRIAQAEICTENNLLQRCMFYK